MENTEFIALEDLIPQFPAHTYWLDSNNIYQGCNNLQAKTFGLSSRIEVIGKTNNELLDPNIAEIVNKNNFEVLNSGIAKIFEEPIVWKNGSIGIVLSHKKPLCDKNGNIIGLLGISTDITQHKKREEKLIKKLEEGDLPLEYILSHTPGHVYWKNKLGIYLGCNDAQAESLGFKHGYEVVGKTDFDLTSDKKLARIFWENDSRIMHSGTSETVEEEVWANDKKLLVLSSKAPLKNKNGEIVGIIGTSLDITEHKKIEKTLKEAKEAAERANNAKTEFLQNIRHDIRTPITGIIGCAEHIKNAKDLSKTKEYSDLLIKSSNALLNFLSDILDSIEATSGNITILKKKFNLESVLLEIIKINQAVACDKELNLKLEYDHSIPKYLVGDPKRLYRIIFELAVNALKYTKQGSVTVVAQLAKRNNDNMVIKIAVKDTGIGIPPDKQEDIFTQFVRLNPSFQGTYGGSGLGLTVAKKFLDDLGAEIYVTSEINKGSTFTCLFPLKEALLSEEFGADSTVEECYSNVVVLPGCSTTFSNPTFNSQASRRVLLVEDHDITAKITKDMLFDLDCQVEVANNGALAISLAEKNNYDIILMDLGLPDITGYEVTEKIRSGGKNKSVPIIGLTAHANAEDKQHCLMVGMNVVFIKPLMREKIENIFNMFVPIQLKQEAGKSFEKSEDKNSSLVLTGDVIDLKLSIQLANGDTHLANEFLKMLVNSFPEDLEKIEVAYKSRDLETVKSIVHKLRGGLSYCGVPRLKEACARFDDCLRSEERERVEDLYSQFLLEFNKVKQAIEKLDVKFG